MKEKIYTIPLNDSFDDENVCPFCYLENNLEHDLIEYTLGPSMMEPDSRIKSNETGFCKNHLYMMLEENKRLSLAIMLSTHLEHIQDMLKDVSIEDKKIGLFRKNVPSELTFLSSCVENCVICDSINQDILRYIKVFYHMWDKESEFRDKVKSHKTLCMRHGVYLLQNSKSALLKSQIIELMQTTLSNNISQLKSFIDMFDYRNTSSDSSRYKEAVVSAVSILRGSTKK